jgi:hypothetical protein
MQEKRNRDRVESFGEDCEGIEIHWFNYWILKNAEKKLGGEMKEAGRRRAVVTLRMCGTRRRFFDIGTTMNPHS